MVKNKHIITALPLVAAILGRKYGVRVVIGGDSAHTDGRTIYLPSLPADGDINLLNLARGFLDHESAHLRATDFKAGTNPTPLEHHICNILEDWRVEQKLVSVFPGCRQNLNWLARHFLLDNSANAPSPDQVQAILQWLLLTVYSWEIPELDKQLRIVSHDINAIYPRLLGQLDSIMRSVPTRCNSTQDCYVVAKEIVDILHNYYQDNLNKENQPHESSSNETAVKPEALAQLEELLNADAKALPNDLGKTVAIELNQQAASNYDNHITVAITSDKNIWQLDAQSISDSRKTTNALRARLHGLLQSSVIVSSKIGIRGRLDTHKLHAFMAGNPKVFRQKGSRAGINTAVHILLDSSGSMKGKAIKLASQVCYAVAHALSLMSGVSIAVTAFPGQDKQLPGGTKSNQTVFPILVHKERMHNKFGMDAEGGTPLASAIWFAMVQMQQLTQKRKLILVITDGQPDSPEAAQTSVLSAINHGYEVYAIGIKTNHVLSLMPNKSAVINNIAELPQAVFTLLQNVLRAPLARK